MEIGLYIAELLSEQDEVSVPGLGTFIKLRVPGSFDESNNVFNPPSYRLTFKEEDVPYSGLSQYISNHKNLSIASAEELIKKFISGIKDSLNNSGISEIKHLGSLYKENGILAFKAVDNFGIAASFYGLKPIAELNSKFAPPAPTQEANQGNNETEAPDYTRPLTEEDETESPKAKLVPILVISFLAIIATLAALFYFDTNFNHFVKDMFASKKPEVQIAETLTDSLNTDMKDSVNSKSPDTILNKIDSPIEAVKSNRELSETLNAPEQTTPLDEDIRYEIIVASFYKESEAQEYIRIAATKGLKAKIAENIPGKMHKISMGTFKDEESATKELEKIQKEINKDAWIARVKPLNNSK